MLNTLCLAIVDGGGVRRTRLLYEDWGSGTPATALGDVKPIPLPTGEGVGAGAGPEESRNDNNQPRPRGPGELLNTMLFVTSDNVKAAEQMSGIVQHPYTLTTPQVSLSSISYTLSFLRSAHCVAGLPHRAGPVSAVPPIHSVLLVHAGSQRRNYHSGKLL